MDLSESLQIMSGILKVQTELDPMFDPLPWLYQNSYRTQGANQQHLIFYCLIAAKKKKRVPTIKLWLTELSNTLNK